MRDKKGQFSAASTYQVLGDWEESLLQQQILVKRRGCISLWDFSR